MNPVVTINSRKMDGEIHKSWRAELLSETEEMVTFLGVFDREIKHTHLGVIRPGTVSYEFYWKNKWFNIFRFHEPEGGLRNFYCNLNQPPRFSGDVLDYVDLDVDLIVWKDFSHEILDLDEFEAHALKYDYSEQLKADVDAALAELLWMIRERKFPFDFQF